MKRGYKEVDGVREKKNQSWFQVSVMVGLLVGRESDRKLAGPWFLPWESLRDFFHPKITLIDKMSVIDTDCRYAIIAIRRQTSRGIAAC